MAEQLENGNGKSLGISIEKRALVEAVSADMDLANALLKGMAFTLHDTTVTPTGAGDYFAKIANTSDYPLVITQLRIYDASAEIITGSVGANYVSATSHAELEPVNRLVGSGVLASDYGQFESDVDITGQGTQAEVFRIKLAATTDYVLDLSAQPIVLLKNQNFSLLAVTGTAAIAYSVDFFFQAIPVVNG